MSGRKGSKFSKAGFRNSVFGTAAVTKAGGMQPLVRLLKSGSEALHSAAAAALEVLTMDGAQRQRLLASLPGYLTAAGVQPGGAASPLR